MKNHILTFLTALWFVAIPITSHASIKVFNSSGAELGHFSDVKCADGVTCTQVDGKLNVVTSYGFERNQVAVTTTASATAAQCESTFINSDVATINLPEASTVLGCRYTFIVGHSHPLGLRINPDTGDRILLETNANGDAVSSSVTGSVIQMEATAANHWTVLDQEQTWHDAN